MIFTFYFFKCGYLINLKLYVWLVHIFSTVQCSLRSRVGNIRTPVSLTSPKTLGLQTRITISHVPWSISDLFRMHDHSGALDTFVHISEWRFGRIIGLWNKNSSVLYSSCPVPCTILLRKQKSYTQMTVTIIPVLSDFKGRCDISLGLRVKILR